MGLDNGLMLRVFNEKIAETRDFCCAIPFFDDSEGDIKDCDVCYWRKCWNVRRLLYDVANTENEIFSYGNIPLTYDAVEKFYASLQELRNRNVWNNDFDNGDTIWSFDEYFYTLGEQINAIKYLLRALKDYEDGVDYQFYFYDSY